MSIVANFLAQGLRNLRRFGRSALSVAVFAGCLTGRAADQATSIIGRPLAPRSGPPGKTMFVEIPSDQSNVKIENRYADPEMWGKRYHEFEIGAIGCGLAIGDYDGDGRPDLFIVSKTESCRLFRNLGDWKFEDVTEKAGVGDQGPATAIWKQGATFADVNNDGLLDIYVCRCDAPNLLYINQGNGTFKEMAHAYGLDVKDASVMASFCDYDRDGWLDVYVQTNLLNNAEHPRGQRDYLFHNNRDGTFTNVTDRAGISLVPTQGNSATWWDFDNDGWPDLYVANDFAAPDILYHNNRDGTFTNVIDATVPHMTYSSMGSDLGDINNDGKIDFMVAEMAATTHQKDQRGMADTRSRSKDLPDGSTTAPCYLWNCVYLNTGTGRCLEAANLLGLAATDWTWAVRFEDLDNDGRLDLYVTNGMHREIHNADLLLRMMTAESAAERVSLARNTAVLNEPNLAFRNLGNLEFENSGASWGLDQKGVSFGAAFGDLDGDGDLDLAYTNYQHGATLLRNDCATGHRVIIDLHGTISNRFGIGATVQIETSSGKQIRQLVLARGYMSSSEPMLHFGLGTDAIIKQLVVTWPSGQVQKFNDLAVDQRYAITETAAVASPPPETNSLPETQFVEIGQVANLRWQSKEEMVDEIGQQRMLPMRQNRRGPALVAGDLLGRGTDDLVIGGTTVEPARLLLRSTAGRFSSAGNGIAETGARVDCGPLLLFDADGDGRNDLLITKGGNSLPPGAAEFQPVLLFNNGGGLSPAPAETLPPLPINVGAAVAADFDRDGRLDVFLGARMLPEQYPLPPRSALLVNRGNHFEDVTDSLAPGLSEVGMVTSALWSDVDGDGWPDLILTLEWGTVKYFHNNQGRSFDDWSEKAGFASAGSGWWTSIASADFNGDGRPDYVVGNVGLNTRFHADATHPALLFYGEFAEGASQVIEAYYEGEVLYPWRSRRELGAAIPSILKKFPKNDSYARSSLTDILGADKLAAARRFAATELRSGVFLSQADGSFRFESLPRIAQIAPLQGIVAGDFDGDGHADIYAVQNSFSPAPVTGRFDGGLSQFLKGDGKGGFSAVAVAESGLIVPDDAKALVVTDLDEDGWPDFVVSRNSNTTLAFRNRGRLDCNSLAVRLKGPAGNSDGIGAVITAEQADGSKQVMEIHAGSGYYSQSSAACFFGYPTANPLSLIHVRWPSGVVTHHSIPSHAHTIVLSAPAG